MSQAVLELTPSRLSARNIGGLVEFRLRRLQMAQVSTRGDITQVLTAMGGRTTSSSFRGMTSHAPGNFTLHTTTTPGTRAWIKQVAHILGHYHLHYILKHRGSPAGVIRCQNGGQVEREADVFAQVLLAAGARSAAEAA